MTSGTARQPAADGLIVVDPDGRVCVADDAARALLGGRCERGAPLDWTPEPNRTHQVWARALVAGERASATGRIDGLQVDIDALPFDETGTAGAVLRLRRRDHADDAVALERLRASFDASLDALYVLEAVLDDDDTIVDFRIADCNPAALAQMGGVERDAFLGQRICEAYPINRTNGLFDRYVRVTTSGEPFQQRLDVPAGQPGAGCYLQQVVALPDRRGVVTSTRDISIVRDAEEERASLALRLVQAQRMESIGLLAGGIAHDFNNLLTAMLGMVELAREIDDVDEVHETVDEIQSLVHRAASLTRRLLAFGRRQELQREEVDLWAQLSAFGELLHRVIPASIDIQLDLGTAPLIVHADASQLEQVLLNLCINARDALEESGGGTIGLTARSVASLPPNCQKTSDHDGPFVAIRVEDDGPGFDGHESEAFEPFYTTKAERGGSGLGLASVATIVDDHHGAVAIETGRARGAVVTVFFPVSDPSGFRSRRPITDSPLLPVATPPVDILVVEDDPTVRELVVEILRSTGHRVTEADNGAAAVERFAAERPDLVIMDGVMPTMSGFQAYHRIAELDPNARVLFMSGYSRSVFPDGFFDGTGHRLLRKPFTRNEVLSSVATALARRLPDDD